MTGNSMPEKQRGTMRRLSDDMGTGPAQGAAVEVASADAEGRLRALVADSPAILYAAAADGSFALSVVSDNLGRITGHEPAVALADPGFWLAHVHPDDRAAFGAAPAGDESTCREYRFRFADDTWHWLRDHSRLRRDQSGRPAELTGSWLEIDELRAIRETLAARAQDLDHANAELEQFAYVASHDLREPLRMIASYMGLLVRRYGDRLDDDAREFTTFAREGAERMDRLILDLLEYSRIGRWNRSKAELALGEVADQAACTLDAQVRATGATVEIARGMPTVTASWEEILRLFQDLIGNALKYRDPARKPVVRVSARRDGAFWLVSVADNGLGIEAEHFDRIFLIFQRLHTRDRYEGTGIGLAICKKIVERHGGRLWLESVPGQGSTFSFTLPVQARPDHG